MTRASGLRPYAWITVRWPGALALPAAPLIRFAGYGLICWVVLFWRLGYPSFWDPDEAHYAQTSREMLAAGQWLVPLYDGQPFFDKPVLFHTFQMVSFALLGATEFAARLVPALAALGLIAWTNWLGTALFSAEVGEVGALMLAVLPATFALSGYAILDTLFTVFLFGGVSLIAVAALRDRPALQYPGYVLLALAVLTKGPVAIVLAGIAFAIALAIAPEARRKLFDLRWMVGLLIVLGLSGPWFLYMWHRFGQAFVDGYFLKENLSLYANSPYQRTVSKFFYLRVVIAGLLPWTPLVFGRLIDHVRGRGPDTAERLLWAWIIAVVGFFTLSQFQYDHYVFPAAPAMCLLAAHAYEQARRSWNIRHHTGAMVGVFFVGVVLVGLGILLLLSWEQLPLTLPSAARLLPIGLIVGGLATSLQLAFRRGRPPALPAAAIGALLLAYTVIVLAGFPAFERGKPIKQIARWMSAHAGPEGHLAGYRLNRWSSSWRFYADGDAKLLETPQQVRAFFRRPGRKLCVMLEREFRELQFEGLPLRIVHQRRGLFATTGRDLRRGQNARWRTFVVTTDERGINR